MSSKGKKANRGNALRKLMRAVPESQTIFNTLIGLGDNFWTIDPSKDRTAAIMGASFLEYALKKAICEHFKSDVADPEFNYLFESDDAPYREFASRIRLARAVGVINKSEYDQLEALRLIRNAFAHTMTEVSFQTKEIADYFEDLKILDDSEAFKILVEVFAPKYSLLGMMPGDKANRMAYAHAVFLLYWKLTVPSVIIPGF